MDLQWLLVPSFFLIALLYASVGHGGASGYLAALSFVAVQPAEMATTALTLNLIVAGAALLSFARSGCLVKSLTWPFVIASVPAAFLGGVMPISAKLYHVLLAAALGVAAWRLVLELPGHTTRALTRPGVAVSAPLGGGIGWLSGAVGIGGGIFLSPLLVLLRWATPKEAAATSAAFILANSAAGLGGRAARAGLEYGLFWPLGAAALAGGMLGAHLGANHFSGTTLKRLLAVVLVVAAAKLLMTAAGAIRT